MKKIFLILFVLIISSCVKSNKAIIVPVQTNNNFLGSQERVVSSYGKQEVNIRGESLSGTPSYGYFGAITTKNEINTPKKGYMGGIVGMYSKTDGGYKGGFVSECVGDKSPSGSGYSGGISEVADSSTLNQPTQSQYVQSEATIVNTEFVNTKANEYPKASYGWENSSINNDKLASADCKEASNEIISAKQTEVLADKLFYYRKALRLCPESSDYHNGLGEVYLVLNRKDDAVFEFKESLRLNPSNSMAQKNLKMLTGNY